MSSSGVDPSDYVTTSGSGGPDIDWGGLGELLAGSLVVTAGLVWTEIYLAIFGAVAAGIRWFGNAVAGLYAALGEAGAVLVSTAFRVGAAFVSGFGILSPIVGVALALAVMWIWMRESQ